MPVQAPPLTAPGLEVHVGVQCLLGSSCGSRSPRRQAAGGNVWGGRSHRKLRGSLAPVRAEVDSC